MKTSWLTVGLSLLAVGAADAQLARTQPTEKLLVLWLTVSNPQDSVLSYSVMDAVRDKVTSDNRYRMFVVPRAKVCEALEASGFPCSIITETQAADLARALEVHAYVTGQFRRDGNNATAVVRVVDRGRSGMAATFEMSRPLGAPANGSPRPSTQVLADTISGVLNTLIKAGEHARACNEAREKGNLRGAIQSAQKAFQIYPNAAAAHLCVAYVYEIQRLPPDSIIAALRRGLAGDSLNTRSWDFLARQLLVKHDSAGAVAAFEGELRADPRNYTLRVGLATLLYRMKQYEPALRHARIAAEQNITDQNINELVISICKDGEMWRCYLEALEKKAELNPGVLGDSAFYGPIIGAALKAPDTTRYLRWSGEAAKRYPTNVAFWKELGEAYTWARKPDSALFAYRTALQLTPNDMATVLLVAKALIDRPTWDSARYRDCRTRNDTLCVKAMQATFAAPIDTAKTYLDRALTAPDSGTRLNATALVIAAGTRLAQQAQAFDRAYPWLDQGLTLVEPRGLGDTTGFRQQLRIPASFWYALSSMQTMGPMVDTILRTKRCESAKALYDRVVRTKEAAIRAARVSPPIINQILQNIARYETYLTQVKGQLKCTSF